MKCRWSTLGWLLAGVLLTLGAGATGAQDDSFQPIFDGKTFDGWKAADMSFWSVEDGALTPVCTPAS